MKVAELVEGRKKRKKPFMWMGIPFAIVASGTGDDTIGSGAGFDGGLSEESESGEEHMFAHWPSTFHLYGPYAAVRSDNGEDDYIKYDVEMIMGKNPNIQLAASKIPSGGVSFILGLDNDYGQKLGNNITDDGATDIQVFKWWAKNAMQSAAGRLGLEETK